MFVPLVRALQRHYPRANITWIISPFAYTLVEEIENIEFIVLDKPKSLADYLRFKKRMKDRHFDVLLAAQASFRANCLYPFIRATRKIGYDKARANDGHRWFVNETIQSGRDHTLEGFLKFAAVLDVPYASPVWNLPVNDAAYVWARSHIQSENRPILVINPAASKPERSWFAASYIEVIRFVLSRWDMQVILIGGPGVQDKTLGDEISANVSVTNLIGQSTPKQLLALIDLATLVLCPDTGPAHMAAAMETPVIALHAVTNVDVSGPYTYRTLAVNAYPDALKRNHQSVDSVPWGTQVHEPWAMTLVSVDAVIARLNHFFVEGVEI
ncbi:MAG: glycosyltransferase family 9 protein [Legionellaceae bacterium]|nr:glycosyltransferase family 9 protein [Legionellaceae bacterium]